MIKIVGIQIGNKKKKNYYLAPNFDVVIGDFVIIETEYGDDIGKVCENPKEINDNNENYLKIISLASENDIKDFEQNVVEAKKALIKCRELVEKYALNMYIIDALYTYNKNQLIFRFMADNRVDFRTLAKDLATIYKTRIELRQMGVRDRAKEIGGYGQCGKPLCCSKFMSDFDSISINMAKNQNIALNPSKINGICGRLLCCLKYENECYKECSKGLPQMNKKIKTDSGEGKVIAVDILKGTYKVNIPDVGIVEFKKDNSESN